MSCSVDPASRGLIIPFGVPDDERGLGIGIAALLHGSAQIGGASLGLAQLHSRGPDQRSDDPPMAVEAFVSPRDWRELAGGGNTPTDVTVVVTGTLEPPGDDGGLLRVVAYDPRDGRICGEVETHLDEAQAGKALVTVFDELWKRLDGELGSLRELVDTDWDTLRSLLLGERCALHDPIRGEPHDRLAAMVHLWRALGDGSVARFASVRLAAVAFDAAVTSSDQKLWASALRMLDRASEEIAEPVEILEAMALLNLRLGDPLAAEARALRALEIAPTRIRLYSLMAEARRAQGDLAGALRMLERGLASTGTNVLLANERGVVLAELGRLDAAVEAWQDVLRVAPLHPAAFANMTAAALERQNVGECQMLVDSVLTDGEADPEVLRRGIRLVLASEPEGLARGTRLVTLAKRLTDRCPEDLTARLVMGRAHTEAGDQTAALEALMSVQQGWPNTNAAAEAQRVTLFMEEPSAALVLDAALERARTGPEGGLDELAKEARRLGRLHYSWQAYVVVGLAESRLRRPLLAREALQTALEMAPGCALGHLELARIALDTGDLRRARTLAERSVVLDAEEPRAFAVLAEVLLGEGKREEAVTACQRAVALSGETPELRDIKRRLDTRPGGWMWRLMRLLRSR